MENRFSRTELLIGEAGISKLKQSRVAVFGIGGVGSFVVEGLARAGVGHLVLVDGDVVCPTNINRQLHATSRTLGQSKVGAMRDRVLDINPEAEVVTHHGFYTSETAEGMLRPDYDYIVDAMDMVSAKIDLVVRARGMGIPIISSMGAGNKLDPTRFQVEDLYRTSVCPLAKVMRKELKKRGIDSLKVVYSQEEVIKPLDIEAEDCADSPVNLGGSPWGSKRRQVPGSISFVPSVAGLIIAGEVVKDLISGVNGEESG